MMDKICQVGKCGKEAKYIVGFGKIYLCQECYNLLSNQDKRELKAENLIRKL